MQSDFTHMQDLQVTFSGEAFPHQLFHSVLTYSDVEAVSLCFGETFEALSEGIEQALWQFGGVPEQHRTDHLSAAVRKLRKEEREEWTIRYQGLMAHYGCDPTTNNAGIAHENGDVEQSHFRFKDALDQALRVRGSRDFADRQAYERFVQDLVRIGNEQ
jgi:transposase